MTKRFSASAAAQLMACPGSANLDVAIPGFVEPVRDEEKGAKAKGRNLHYYLEQTSNLPAKDLEALAVAMQYMADLRRRRRFKVLTEHEATADWLVSKPTTTPDVVLYTTDELHIVDYKSGAIPVTPIENEQLMFLAVTFAHLAPKAKSAHLHIIQPWAPSGCQEWEISTNDLADFMLRAQDAERKILAKSTQLNPSDHCTFCPANPHSRGDKGNKFCPPMLQLLYPSNVDEAAILALI